MLRCAAILKVKQTIMLLLPFLSSLTGCSQYNNGYMLFENPGYNFPYQLAEPGKSWKLPNTLVEISGVSYIDNQRLACVQDEKGILYIFNLQAGTVELKIVFSDDGDYEDIEIVENDAWVLKSNGTLYKVTDYLKTAEPGVKKYATALSGKNDAEGLAYDPVSNNLLIACKEDPFTDEKEGSGFKAIYRFNPETKLLDVKPYLLISLDTIRYYKGDATFKPSGIAIQPVTGNVFILAAAGNLMVVFSGKGEMLAMIKLSPKVFPQPEGICFSPDGTLYISNEGAGREGTILQFEMKVK
jgi:uncharacterized protein YjiK